LLTDGGGAVTASYCCNAFGQVIGSGMPEQGFSSKEYNERISLSYFDARYLKKTASFLFIPLLNILFAGIHACIYYNMRPEDKHYTGSICVILTLLLLEPERPA
jgi:hypothetical protein